ncbi:MAG TPA: hypothetical protein VFX97_17055 [Pyrinomonadaceae bacterium]|nr:hypothetical protein [Pyrinomonadaceae bacterium]
MLRISVSDLDSYRYYKANEEMTLQDILSRLRREEPPSPSMLAGRALHCALEDAQWEDEQLWIDRDGFRFHFICDAALTVSAVRELKGEMPIDTPSGPVTLVGVVDAIGDDVTDYKLTGRFEAERFADSYQWRCYLMMFGMNRFVYKVFVGAEDSSGTGFDGKPFAEWLIREYHEMPVYRYPGMEQDVKREVAEFAAFLRQYGFEQRKAA